MATLSLPRRLLSRYGVPLFFLVGLPLGTALTWALMVHFLPMLPAVDYPLGP